MREGVLTTARVIGIHDESIMACITITRFAAQATICNTRWNTRRHTCVIYTNSIL